MFEQHDEHVERFRRDGHETAFPPQPPLDGVHDERTEGVPAVPGRFVKPGAAHVAPLPSRVVCEPDVSVEVWMALRAKSIAFSSLINVLHRETTPTRGQHEIDHRP